MFPPDIIAATLLFLKRGSLRMAASTIAPDNYTTIFILSINKREASIISYYETNIMSLRYVFRTLKVFSPRFVRTPSAKERGG